jgi:glycyl-tRNA synthetase beta chain
MAANFLLEIGVEEMPARFLNPALNQLKSLAESSLQENRLKYEEVHTMGTPRRLTLFVRGLAEKQESLKEEVKGPAEKVAFKDGKPTRAAEGFAKSQGVSVQDLITKPVGHVDYVFAVRQEEGRPAEDLLKEIAPALITGLHFPKPMRWGGLEFRFARPIRWLLALYSSRVISFELAGQQSDRVTYGHRFMSTGPVTIERPEDYLSKLEEVYVLAEPGERKERIRKQIEELVRQAGGKVMNDEDLLDEVTNLVEYPTALMGSFDAGYLELPPEVLITPMKEHQRYFPVQDSEGNLLPRFIAVRNGGQEHLDVVRAGNEKVLKARLEDAAFFWQEDLKETLAARVDDLKKVVFQETLGTMYQKVQRIAKLSGHLIKFLGGDEQAVSVTRRAAMLAKADLVTNMVYEFPELQGIMGREYALYQGEKPEVAQAIFEHYLPRHAGDELPDSLPGKALSLADKTDTLVGCFAIGIQPTGSQDPYALRRQALGICNIVLDYGPGLSLKEMVHRAYEGLKETVDLQYSEEVVWGNLQDFIRQRLRGLMTDMGLRYDTVEAVLATGFDDIAGVYMRGRAVEEFRRGSEFEALLTAFTRASNLSKKAPALEVNTGLLQDDAEKKLYEAYTGLVEEVRPYLKQQDYPRVLENIARLRKPVDEFFEQVMVMVDEQEVRENRLVLLRNIARFIGSVADFSKIVVERDNEK